MNPTRIALLSFVLTFFAQVANAAQTVPTDETAPARLSIPDEDLVADAFAPGDDDARPAIRELGSSDTDATAQTGEQTGIRPLRDERQEYTTFASR